MDKIRNTISSDIKAMMEVIDSTGLFPGEMLPEMIADYFAENQSEAHWLTAESNGKIVGLAYFLPERLTQLTLNLLLIAVHKEYQGRGLGKAILKEVVSRGRELDSHLLLVETSGHPHFENTRKFYTDFGFQVEAKIRDFYQIGEDKVVFWMRL